MQVQLTYQAKDKEEFIELVERFGEKVVPTVQKPSDKGPNETEFNRVTGQRLKLSGEEKNRVESGSVTREMIAEERLTAYAPPASNDDFDSMPSIASLQGQGMVVSDDDGEEMV